jgi:chromosome segregation ATPase
MEGPTPAPTAPDAAPAPPPRRIRRWPWVVVSVLAVALGLAAVAVAADQREVAAEWRDRAQALQLQRDAGVEREDRLTGQLDDLTSLLSASEGDVGELEARVRALADEKAQAEDTATTVRVERDVFSEVTGRIASATDALDRCVEQLFELQTASVDAFNRSTAGEAVDVAPLNATAQQVTASCNEARTAAANAGAAADRLLAP